ncbi:MAG: Methyltransferase type 11 [Frankiales bacterium]|nr:Methyltransferase type 11 [Frankiales bacterium]
MLTGAPHRDAEAGLYANQTASVNGDSGRLAREQAFHDRRFSVGTRDAADKYYVATRASESFYVNRVLAAPAGSRALEYGCGLGSHASDLADRGVRVDAVDLSPVAIEQAREEEAARGRTGVRFQVMDAHALSYDDQTFDLVCGSGILHHLELSRAFAELARVLKPGGRVVFLEPLGHNPAIRLYRRLTPRMRTSDEHPLLVQDLRLAEAYFQHVEARFFHLLSLASVPLRGTRLLEPALSVLERLDDGLLRALPAVRRYAWMTVLEARRSP